METAENRGSSMTEDAPTWGNGEYDSSISPAQRNRRSHKKQQSDGQTKKEKNDSWWKLLLRWIRRKMGFTAMCCTLLSSYVALADTWYVRCNGGSDTNDGKTKESAFATLGKAIDTAQANDSIIIGDGTYFIVQISKPVRLLSENGYANTIIDCSQSPQPLSYTSSASEPSSLGSFFSGITFLNGCALWLGCNNGYAKSTMDSCVIKNFSNDNYYGAIIYYGTVRNCIFCNNSYKSGSLFSSAAAYNCSITQNTGCGVANQSRLYNCIIYSTGPASWGQDSSFYNCCTDDPKFVNNTLGNFRLLSNSPCRNAGNNSYANGLEFDIAGNTRIAEDCVDIGAYEYIPYFNVTFDVGEHGYISSGETNQTVANGSCPVIPTVETLRGWGFVQWTPDPSVSVESNVTYIAQYIHYQCEPINMSPTGGSFSNASQEVTLSCDTEDATIYYTIDGSEPSATNGRRYKGPFDIYQTTTVKAIAVKDDWMGSAVASATFTKANEIGPAINMLEVLPDNDKTHPWEVVTDVTHDGVSAVKSGEIEDEESTTLKVTVYGAGQLSFWWKTSCEPSIGGEYYDYATFYNGSTAITNLAGVTDWQQVWLDVAGTGKHTFKWTYQKDDSGSTVPDGMWLDQVQWLPATTDYYSDHTLTTETPVKYNWLRQYGLGVTTDFESAAKAKSGKYDGAGRELTVEQEYIAGTDPTNMTSHLTSSIELVDGLPVITWKPDLNEGGAKSEREYKIWGSAHLVNGGEWEWPTNALHRFFKVTVEMP